jgi:hypothetical protein
MSDYILGRVVPLNGFAIESMRKPLDGHVMEPSSNWKREDQAVLSKYDQQIASIVAGHNWVQEWPEDKQAEFAMFVREVVRTVV